MNNNYPYRSYTQYLESKYGYRVYRVGVDAGFSCPHRFGKNKEGGCVYCDAMGAKAMYLRSEESNFTKKSSFVENLNTKPCDSINLENIKTQVEKGCAFIKRRYNSEHFSLYFQSFSNTYAPVEVLKKVYDYSLSLGCFEELIVSTRPDCIDEEKVKLLSSYKGRVKNVCVELGLQSGSDKILKAMNRGHDLDCFFKASKLIKQAGLELSVHIMLGFPGESSSELQKTVDAINLVHPNNIKIHNLNIVSGTKLYQDYLKGEVTAPCVKRHMINTVFVLRRIPNDIVVERLICETPSHRLASPRLFMEKNRYLRRLEAYMNDNNYQQGDLC